MNVDPHPEPSNTVSLRDYQEMRWNEHLRLHSAHEVAHVAEHAANQAAIAKSDDARVVRDAANNEFRGQLTDQAATFARQDTVEARFIALATNTDARLVALQSRLEAAITSAQSSGEAQAKVAGDRLAALERQLAALSGRSGGASATVSYVVMGIGAIATILTIIVLIATKFLNG